MDGHWALIFIPIIWDAILKKLKFVRIVKFPQDRSTLITSLGSWFPFSYSLTNLVRPSISLVKIKNHPTFLVVSVVNIGLNNLTCYYQQPHHSFLLSLLKFSSRQITLVDIIYSFVYQLGWRLPRYFCIQLNNCHFLKHPEEWVKKILPFSLHPHLVSKSS